MRGLGMPPPMLHTSYMVDNPHTGLLVIGHCRGLPHALKRAPAHMLGLGMHLSKSIGEAEPNSEHWRESIEGAELDPGHATL